MKNVSISRAFTLIEMMIAIAVMGVIAMVVIPRFANMVRKSNEGSTKGGLGGIRSALSIYYGDMEGQYPSNLYALTISGKYLRKFPTSKTPNYHADTSRVRNSGAIVDDGRWHYDNSSASPTYGGVSVECTHTDTKGTVWSSY